ncbi:MAG: hypothetical protein ACRDSR_05315 [Pseudonocardiaceae bacterium]
MGQQLMAGSFSARGAVSPFRKLTWEKWIIDLEVIPASLFVPRRLPLAHGANRRDAHWLGWG